MWCSSEHRTISGLYDPSSSDRSDNEEDDEDVEDEDDDDEDVEDEDDDETVEDEKDVKNEEDVEDEDDDEAVENENDVENEEDVEDEEDDDDVEEEDEIPVESLDYNEGKSDDDNSSSINETEEDISSERAESADNTACYVEVESKKNERQYTLDDFEILKTIGTGTFGRVCLCKDKQTGTYGAMKILTIADVIRLKQVEHVKNEKNILSEVSHPFIVNMSWSAKDGSCLYMLFEYVCGGELFTFLRNAGKFSPTAANFYACEIILALEYLHSLMIVYRDLKPENLLINRDGHLKITDFGFAKQLRDRTWTLCGTPEYLAPEIIQSKGHNRAVDWWALGILIYEMIVGYPPFYDDNPFGVYEKILSGKIDWPKCMDSTVKDLVKKLLVLDRTKRLGNMKNGAEDVKKHKWFKHIKWSDVIHKKYQPPIMPEVKFDGDTSNFDNYEEVDWNSVMPVDEDDERQFIDF